MNNANYGASVTAKKKKKKFNFIDFLIVLLIIAIICVVVYLFSPWAQIEKLWTKDKAELTFFVEIKDVDIEFIDMVKEGDAVIDAVSKNSLGSIAEAPQVEKAFVYDYVLDEHGQMTCVISEQPNKYNITIKINASADFEENVGFTVNGRRIAVGELLDMRLPQYACSGTCVQIYE